MKPREYQEEISNKGLKILKNFKLLYLSMEVRTGKTLTALLIAFKYGAKRVLFVTKKKAIPSIEDDYKKLGYDYLLTVVNFESLHKVQDDEFDFVIVDEAHSIGAYPKPSKRTIALKAIVGDKPLILLSGTPTPESYSQLYHQLWISNNSPFEEKTFYKWAKKYVKVTQRMINGFRVNDYSKADTKLVKEKVDPIMIAFSQKDAGFESLVEEKIHLLEPPYYLKMVFEKLKKDRVIDIGGQIVSAPSPAILLQKLHQLSSGTIITDEGERITIDFFKGLYISHTFANQHIAIFYKFVSEKDMLEEFLDNIVYTPEEFNRDPNSIFIGQYQSAREGVNLSTAEALIMISVDFSAVSYFQARARLQTKDRKTPAKLHWIFSRGLLDEYVYEAVSSKKDFTLSYYGKRVRG